MSEIIAGLVGNKIKDLINTEKEPHFEGSLWTRCCSEEIVDPIEGVITGEIPEWIKGSLLQNGPGSHKFGNIVLNHVFDGMALLHRFNIDNGKVTYQCRFIQSDAYNKITKENKMGFNEFGTVISNPMNIFQRFLQLFKSDDGFTDNTLVTIYPFGEDYYALTESPMIHKFDPETLETFEKVDLSKLTGIVSQPAHPHVAEDGKVYNVGLCINSSGSTYTIFCVPEGENKFENVKIIAKIPAHQKWYPSYIHSFGMTENYFIVIEQPLAISVPGLLKSRYLKNTFLSNLKWLSDQLTYIYIVERETGNLVHTFHAEAFFYFHTINSYEKDDHIVIDLSCYRNGEILSSLKMDTVKKTTHTSSELQSFQARPLRFVFPLKYPKEGGDSTKNLITLSGSTATAYSLSDGSVYCMPELLADSVCEFGTVNFQKYFGKKYQYFYSSDLGSNTDSFGKMSKVNVDEKTRKEWYEENVYPGEGLFIPAPNAQSEDDGVVITSLLWGGEETNRVGLLVLDGKTFKEIGRCEFKDLKTPIPKCFHGHYVDERK